MTLRKRWQTLLNTTLICIFGRHAACDGSATGLKGPTICYCNCHYKF